jgi:hypothetical protein
MTVMSSSNLDALPVLREDSVGRADLLLTRILLHVPTGRVAEASQPVNRWLKERRNGESLAAYMVRHRLLDRRARRSLSLLREGTVRVEAGSLEFPDAAALGRLLPETLDVVPGPAADAHFPDIGWAGDDRRWLVASRLPNHLPEIAFPDTFLSREAITRFAAAVTPAAPAPRAVPTPRTDPTDPVSQMVPVAPAVSAGPRQRDAADLADEDTQILAVGPSPAGAPGSSSVSVSAARPASDPPHAAVTRPRVGMQLGKCLLTEKIGQGGSSVVFRALHRTLDVSVAVKVLLMDNNPGSEIMASLRGEARLLAKLAHPNIVRVLDFEADGPFPYLVLEFVEGLSLAELISQSGRLRGDRAIRIAMQVADGLKAAAALGIVHRDIKPANILLTREGEAKVADLGLALVADHAVPADSGSGSDSSQGMSLNEASSLRSLVGTMAYMSPEQAAGAERLDHRSDIYSLGATLYHAVVGQPPFKFGSMLEMMRKHATEMPVPPAQAVPEVGAKLSAVIMRMLAKRPEQRFSGYDELQSALTACLGGAPPPADQRPPSSSGRRSGSRWSLINLLFRGTGDGEAGGRTEG